MQKFTRFYKTIRLLMLAALTCSITNARATGFDSLFWAVAAVPEAQQATGDFTGSPTLNALLRQYNVTKYEKAFPFAKTAKLLQVYEIGCNCNIDNLMAAIRANFPTMYSGFKKLDNSQIMLYDPGDHLWNLTLTDPTNYLWHLKKIQADLAWDITMGSPSVKTGILDTEFDLSHPDLATKMNPNNPYTNTQHPCNPSNSHGTGVATFVAGQTTLNGISSGAAQLASVGFNTMMECYPWGNYATYLQKAVHASSVKGVKVLTSSAGFSWGCPDSTGIEEWAVKEILNNNTTIIVPAGNGDNGTHNECASLDPVNHSAFFPLSPYYDERVIVVSSTGKTDMHSMGPNGIYTHSHYPDVDLCAPGENLWGGSSSNCGNQWFITSGASGTSFSTPIVAGVAALMYSINPCMTPALCQDLLKGTTDPIVDAADFPNGVGTGRVNAYKAVKAAQEAYSGTLELYVKDRPEDIGNETYPYHWQADRDESPDIWVRNQPDGFTNRVHQDPEFQVASSVYVYVHVRNKSCAYTTGNELLSLYWSKGSTMSSWPQNWDGSQPFIGDVIGSTNLYLEPGRDTILEFEWTILNPNQFDNWATCLLARIENSTADPITLYPGNLADEVFFNNNIAMRNVSIVDIIPGIPPPPTPVTGIFFPYGNYVFVGNSTNTGKGLDFTFVTPAHSSSLVDKAEIRLIFDSTGWVIFQPALVHNPRIKILRDKEVLILNDSVTIPNVSFPPNTRVPVYVGYSFLMDEVSGHDETFNYHLREYITSTSSITGGMHYTIKSHPRSTFHANAGTDKEIREGQSVTLTATDITEPAFYNWYNETGSRIYQGKSFSVSPLTTQKYKLEVIAESDGFKDYDEVQVKVNPFWIQSLSPNPATNEVNVGYVADKASSAYLTVINETATLSINYAIDVHMTSKKINFTSAYQPGIYTVILVCDGIQRDTKSFVIH